MRENIRLLCSISNNILPMNAIIGALIGDAAGAPLEFYGEDITDIIAYNATKMPGGGKLRIGPGQITDDGELTLTLWRVLRTVDPHDGFPADFILKHYADWYNSAPFDIGFTCSQAFDTAAEYIQLNNGKYDGIVKYTSSKLQHLLVSQANGALMRVTPIATWVAGYPDISAEKAAEYARNDAILSHANIICQDANAVYTFALVHLLRGVSPEDTLLLVDEYVRKYIISDVYDWFLTKSKVINDINCKMNIGHVKHAFCLAMYFLRNPTILYKNAIIMTLMKGGDTDTNAAIVGGIVATYQPIPEDMLIPVITFDSTNEKMKYGHGKYRPREFCVKYVLEEELK